MNYMGKTAARHDLDVVISNLVMKEISGMSHKSECLTVVL